MVKRACVGGGLTRDLSLNNGEIRENLEFFILNIGGNPELYLVKQR